MLLTTPLVLLSNIITVPRFRKHPAFLYLSWLIIDYRGDSGRPANRGTVRGQGAGEDQPGASRRWRVDNSLQIDNNCPRETGQTSLFSPTRDNY